jgi:glycosyltransferase involved in cell wall biosynthesis
MKILWYSNAPWTGTGYGQQTDLFTQRLKKAGHEVAIAANYGLEGAKIDWDGIPVYPRGYDTWSNDIVPLHVKHFFRGERGMVVTLCDQWVLRGEGWREMDMAAWTPVDHQPLPPKVLAALKANEATPVAMSKWGEERMLNAGLENVMYVPHGIDTRVFKPMKEFEGTPVRKFFGVPDDKFVFGMNAANKGNHKIRKSFPEAFTAFSMIHAKYPDTLLFLHTEKFGHTMGVDLARLATACGIPDDAIRFTDQYAYRLGLQNDVLAALYNTWDCLLAPSMGEGFGIPVIEAQACGIPVIVSDFSAQPELVGSGWTVSGVRDWDEGQGSFLFLPDVIEIAAAMEDAVSGGGDRKKARQFALGYDADTVFEEFWVPVIDRFQQRFDLPDVDFDVAPVEGLKP